MAQPSLPPRSRRILRYIPIVLLALVAALLIIAAVRLLPSALALFQPSPLNPDVSLTLTPSRSATPSVTFTQTLPPAAPLLGLEPPAPSAALKSGSPLPVSGSAFLSIYEAGHAHLFAFDPVDQSFTRITSGDWDDITPSVSPDGLQLAFASNRSGVWELYLMSLQDGVTHQLTVSSEFESSPSWSPDGLWLAYEAYLTDESGSDLEILIRPLDGSQQPIRLTNDPAADFSPAWSPFGRQIAFVSTRTGDLEIWLADLDHPQGPVLNLSREPESDEAHPAWSPDGRHLAWSSRTDAGVGMLRIFDPAHPNDQAVSLESGEWPAWSPDGDLIIAAFPNPNQTYLTGYRLSDHSPFFPLLALSGELGGITWTNGALSSELLAEFSASAAVTLQPAYLQTIQAGPPTQERGVLVTIPAVQVGLPLLLDRAAVSFSELRLRLAQLAGWDFFAILESAYIPLTSPLEPGSIQNWLYTGRAVLANTAPLNAGWMVLLREDFGSETYWRLYMRARFQDGTQGSPLQSLPYDFSARHSGDPLAYEAGGRRYSAVPKGYWIDLTRLAAAYGWERLPSLSSWRSSYSGIRYNELVFRQGLDWMNAMLQVYPREALNTPTRVSSPTMTPTFTNTPTFTPSNTPTKYLSPTPSPSLTRRPTATFTPRPP